MHVLGQMPQLPIIMENVDLSGAKLSVGWVRVSVLLCLWCAVMGYSNYYPHPPVEEPWNFQGRGCINLGISRGEGALTLEFPGERCINFKFPGEGVH
jgi:hypothetical protein